MSQIFTFHVWLPSYNVINIQESVVLKEAADESRSVLKVTRLVVSLVRIQFITLTVLQAKPFIGWLI